MWCAWGGAVRILSTGVKHPPEWGAFSPVPHIRRCDEIPSRPWLRRRSLGWISMSSFLFESSVCCFFSCFSSLCLQVLHSWHSGSIQKWISRRARRPEDMSCIWSLSYRRWKWGVAWIHSSKIGFPLYDCEVSRRVSSSMFGVLLAMEPCSRQWALLENVSHLMSKSMKPLRDYVLEDRCFGFV